jgi:hypothetical protein
MGGKELSANMEVTLIILATVVICWIGRHLLLLVIQQNRLILDRQQGLHDDLRLIKHKLGITPFEEMRTAVDDAKAEEALRGLPRVSDR